MAKIVSKNPATGEILAELDATAPEQLPELFARARKAQLGWAALSPKKRSAYLYQVREVMLNHIDELVEVISKENGKPRVEAMIHDLLTSVEIVTYFAKKAPRLLRDQKVPLRLYKHRRAYLSHWPLGTVAIIAPWNYPVMIPFSQISMAVAAGNSVVFKPSEITPLVGLKIQELFDEAGLPDDLVQTVIGDGTLGAAIIQQKPNKIFFTGSVATGKKIMAAAAEHLIPVSLELGGKNPLIILPDANLDFATSAALWGSYSNSGQICGAMSRIIVHEGIAEQFASLLKEKMGKLRQGRSEGFENDLGAITMEKQKAIYDQHLNSARQSGANFLAGGVFSEDRNFLKPTLLTAPNIENMEVYQDETFGPIVSLTTYKTVAEAVRKANQTRYGLSAAVIGNDLAMAENIAKQLESGTVTINEVVYTAGIPEAPWGGVKESGFGKSHSDQGFYEFVNARYISRPRSRLFVFKSPFWFPYTPFQYATWRQFFFLYRRHWTDKIKAFPHFLWNLVQFIKSEKRL